MNKTLILSITLLLIGTSTFAYSFEKIENKGWDQDSMEVSNVDEVTVNNMEIDSGLYGDSHYCGSPSHTFRKCTRLHREAKRWNKRGAVMLMPYYFSYCCKK